MEQLKANMLARRAQAFRPGTTTNHKSQAELFIAFCTYINREPFNPDTETICLYIEYLAQNFSSPQSIANYVSGIRFLHKITGINCLAIDSFEVGLMLRACNLTIQNRPNRKLPISLDILQKLVQITHGLGAPGSIFKCAILMSFYGFLRQSNIAPRSTIAFDPRRNTCRQDIFITPPGMVVLLKWTKTSQDSNTYHLIPLPEIPSSNLCPVRAYKQMIKLLPTTSPDQPLLVLPTPDTLQRYMPVTIRWLADMLDICLQELNLDSNLYSLHSLRRGGATASFRLGVNYMHIKRHGAWRSDSFWNYITSEAVCDSPVAKAFANSLKK